MLKKIRALVCFLVCLLVYLLTVVFIPLVKQIHQNEVGAVNPVDLNRLMWLGAGAGSKGIVGGIVKGFLPQVGITPDIVAAGIGFWLAQQGGERMGVFGEGMLIAAIGQLVRQPIESIFGQIGKPPAPTPEATAAAAAKTSNQGSPEESADAYLAAAYGIT